MNLMTIDEDILYNIHNALVIEIVITMCHLVLIMENLHNNGQHHECGQ